MPQELLIPAQIDLEQFISKEAHDLKAPFNRILGFLKLVLKGMDGPIPDLAKEDLTTVYANSMHALLLMSSLVEISRLNSGERRLHLVDLQAGAAVAQALNDWKKLSPRTCPVRFAEPPPDLTVFADEMRLRQCLVNWFLFLLEYVPTEAELEIELSASEDACLLQLQARGTRDLPPIETAANLYGFIARENLALQNGELLAAEADEQGARVVFALKQRGG